MQDQLFTKFQPVSKEEWLKKVEKDLKGKPFDGLKWEIEDGITLDPFYHPEDQPEPAAPLASLEVDNEWEIGEYIEVEDLETANKLALQALKNGVQALGFILRKHIQEGDMAKLLKGIHPEMVSLNFAEFYTDKQPLFVLNTFVDYLQHSSADLRKIQGSMDFDPVLDWNEPPYDMMVSAIKLLDEKLPAFKCLQINGREYYAETGDRSTELSLIVAKGSQYLAALQEKGLDISTVNQYLQFSVAVGKSYFVEIAKLRALKLMWLNVLKAYGVEHPEMPEVVVHIAKESQDENVNTNMIRASTQAMSAVIGGADRLYLLPANAILDEEATEFYRHIARNVQHILKEESYLNRVIDPGAGSYYIEEITVKLAENAWKKFQQLEKENAFG